jgi:hypothetical protein
MSNFKKMKLVGEHDSTNNKRSVFRTEKYTTSKHLRRIGDLDQQMNDIINSNLDEFKKVKLYSQALRKFLTFKKKHEEDEEIAKRISFSNITLPKIVPVRIPKAKVRKSQRIITPRRKGKIIIPGAPKKHKISRNITPPSTTTSPKSSSPEMTSWSNLVGTILRTQQSNKSSRNIAGSSKNTEQEGKGWIIY